MTDFLDDIEQKLDGIEKGGAGRYYKPLSLAADEFIRFAENPHLRVHTGIQIFDEAMRGVAPGELCLINGFAHSGKTVLATEIMLANQDTPIVLFTPDETRPAVLTKLAAADTGVGVEELERRIYQRDADARKILLDVAAKYQRLAVYDDNVTIHMMESMLKESAEAFGDKPKAVIFDYAEQLNEQYDTKSKLDALKRFGKDHQVAMFVLHQTSRSAGAGGKALGIDSGSFGGEQQATFLITVRRKLSYFKDQLQELEYKLANATNPNMQDLYASRIHEIRFELIPEHHDTVSMALQKNKRPPMQKVEERDFKMDQTTGRVSLVYDEQDDERGIDDEFQVEMFPSGSGRELLRKD